LISNGIKHGSCSVLISRLKAALRREAVSESQFLHGVLKLRTAGFVCLCVIYLMMQGRQV
jgi:hypothetical protein